MSSAPKHLSNLWELPEVARTNGIKLLCKIFNNILSNPSNRKYHSLNFSKIRRKLDKCSPCIYLLYCAGFKESEDGNRLEWQYNNHNVNALKSVNMLIVSIHSKPRPASNQNINVNNSVRGNDIDEYKKVQQQNIKSNLAQKQLQRQAVKQRIAAQRKENKHQQRKENEMRLEQKAKKEMSADYIKQQMVLALNNTRFADQMESIAQLLNDGYSLDEVRNAMQLSFNYSVMDDDDIKINKQRTENDSVLQKMKNYFDNQAICVCGEKLRKMDSWQTAYGDKCNGVWCDFCENECKQNDVFYHCGEGYNDEHKNGYDICRFCAENKENGMDSMYLLNKAKQNRKTDDDGAKCHILMCGNLVRIRDILQKYNIISINVANNDGKYTDIDISDVYNEDYDDVQLLEDFHHLLYEHGDKYEDIYQLFMETICQNTPCELGSCSVIRRNHRNRVKSSRSSPDSMYFSKDTNDIVRQQLIDTIHCHYFHSFDIGYKKSNKEKSQILKYADDEKENDTIRQRIFKYMENKRKTIQQIPGMDYMKNNEKFMTLVTSKEPQEEKTNIYTNDVNQSRAPYFSFGYRYYYDEQYKNSSKVYDDVRPMDSLPTRTAANISDDNQKIYTLGSWYIAPKHRNLKQELLTNSICRIAISHWNQFRQKSTIQVATEKAKSMSANNVRFKCVESMDALADMIGTIVGNVDTASITQPHLIAMMVYCDMDVLQRKFSETYRRIPYNESDESLKARHGNFYHLGKLLRECVEKYGSSESETILYHGINIKLEFASTTTKIHGPVSTSADFSVAVGFCCAEGMLLEFNLSYLVNGRYFDCQWLSSYSHESEVFFVGGFSKFIIKSIWFPDGTDYGLYVVAISQMVASFDVFDWKQIPMNKLQQKMLYLLLVHKLHGYYPQNAHYYAFKELPSYVATLLDNQCKNIESVSLMLHEGNDLIDSLYKRLFFYDYGWINLELVTKLYPNLKSIFYRNRKMDVNMLSNASIYKSVLEFAKKWISVSSLTSIVIDISYGNEFYVMARNAIKKYKFSFQEAGWSIYLDVDFLVMQSQRHDNCVEAILQYKKQHGHAPNALIKRDFYDQNDIITQMNL